MSVGTDWQAAIHQVFNSITDTFNLWTNDNCACHVHVSVGPGKKAVYTLPQLVQVAKGAFFFEAALRELLPRERRENRYALANWRCFATNEYWTVGQNGWQPVWTKIANAARTGKAVDFAKTMTISENDPEISVRYRSTSFNPFEKLHTVELRRQAGVASAETAINRVLLAVTLNVASLEYNFDTASQSLGKRHLNTPELIAILNNTLTTRLPAACQDEDFRDWLEECYANYTNDDLTRMFDEAAINEREKNYRNHGQPYVSTPPPPLPPHTHHPNTIPHFQLQLPLPHTNNTNPSPSHHPQPPAARSTSSGTTATTTPAGATSTLTMRPAATSSVAGATRTLTGNVSVGRNFGENDVRYTPTNANPTGAPNNGYTRRLV